MGPGDEKVHDGAQRAPPANQPNLGSEGCQRTLVLRSKTAPSAPGYAGLQSPKALARSPFVKLPRIDSSERKPIPQTSPAGEPLVLPPLLAQKRSMQVSEDRGSSLIGQLDPTGAMHCEERLAYQKTDGDTQEEMVQKTDPDEEVWKELVEKTDPDGEVWKEVVSRANPGGDIWKEVVHRSDPNGTVWKEVVQRTEPGGAVWKEVVRRTHPGGEVWKEVVQRTDPGGEVWKEVVHRTDPNGTVWKEVVPRTDPGGEVWKEVVHRTYPNGTVWKEVVQRTDPDGEVWKEVVQRTDPGGEVWKEVVQKTDRDGEVWEEVQRKTDHGGEVWEDVTQETNPDEDVWEEVVQKTDSDEEVWEEAVNEQVEELDEDGESSHSGLHRMPSGWTRAPSRWNKTPDSDKDIMVSLQDAIARGDCGLAASLASKLAQRRCPLVVRSHPGQGQLIRDIRVEICGCDVQNQVLPSSWKLEPDTTIGQLKERLHRQCSLAPSPAEQRWVIGSAIADDDNATLSQYNVCTETEVGIHASIASLIPLDLGDTVANCAIGDHPPVPINAWEDPESPFHDPDTLQDEFYAQQLAASFENERPQGILSDLLTLEAKSYIPSTEPFDCSICFENVQPGEGITLRECFHSFCMDCLSGHVKHCDQPVVKCPYIDGEFSCDGTLQHREMQMLVDEEDFQKHLNRSLTVAEGQTANSFHCKTPNCQGWCIHEPETTFFYCAACDATNCINCKAIHTGKDCKEYQEYIKLASANDKDALASLKMMEELLSKGEAMKCPKCSIILQRVGGCDWLQCSMCRTEVCWATKGPRWGPKGRGDTSGGCKCRVKGKLCHPNCGNCH